MGKIISVNVGQPRNVEFRGRVVATGIYKSPVAGRMHVEGVNVVGDDQADRRVHGGIDKSVYAYSVEAYAWWSAQLGRELLPGMFGDNLTTEGVDIGGAVVGQSWRIGDVVLEVSEPRLPCFKLGIRMDDPRFPLAFSAAGRPGTYLRIVNEGSLVAGDRIEIGSAPAHGLSVADIARIHHRAHEEAGRLLDAEELSESWKDWARSVSPA